MSVIDLPVTLIVTVRGRLSATMLARGAPQRLIRSKDGEQTERQVYMFKIRRIVMLLAVVLVPTLALGACGGGDEGNVEDAVRAAVDAWNERDVEGFLAHFTDKGFQESFDAPKEEGRLSLSEFIGDPSMTVRKLSNTKVSGNTATIEFEAAFGKAVELTRNTMVKEGDVWKFDGEEQLSPAIPSGVTAVDVQLAEFAFVYDRAEAAGGDVAFRLENIGEQEHEFFIAKVPEGPPVPEILELLGAGTEVGELIGGIQVEPGKQRNLVFSETLSPGRYAVVCFLSDVNDPDGTPHALKGMFSDFTVQ